MQIKKVELSKFLKLNIGNFSNVTVGVAIGWELKEDEEFDYNEGWDIINRQISSQKDLDQSWIKNEETKDYYKTTIKIPK